MNDMCFYKANVLHNMCFVLINIFQKGDHWYFFEGLQRRLGVQDASMIVVRSKH